jgi:hypothetical protein
MFVALDGEALETSLIKVPMSNGPVRNSPAHRVCVSQPAEVIRHLSIFLGPNCELPVVRHHAVREDADRVSLVSLNHHLLERLEVGVFAKEVHSPDGSIQDVMDHPTRSHPRSSWHKHDDTHGPRSSQYELRPRFRDMQTSDIVVWSSQPCRTENGGKTMAVLFSLVSSYQRHGHDPFAYRRDVLERVPVPRCRVPPGLQLGLETEQPGR